VNATRYDTAILGGGAVGIVAALCSARQSATVLILRSRTESCEIPRIETVPAPMLSLLIDYGVHPQLIGVDRLYENQHVAWECADPEIRRGRAMAHIDKAKLQCELLNLASKTPHLGLLIDPRAPCHGKTGWFGPEWSARRLIDATGRAAITAARRVMAPKPWVARPFWCAAPAPATMREFRIAALPNGYVCRVGSNEVDSLWIAGRGATLSASPQAIESAITRAGAEWLLEGLPALESLQSGRAFPVSAQWAEGSAAIAVGDAALARDVLSSQGMACGLSSASYGVAVESERDLALLRQHQLAERASHLQSLSQLLAACRYGDSLEWQPYRQFIAAHVDGEASQDTIWLSEGRLMQQKSPIGAPGPAGHI
jgi:2-polyprenyl-6-methoxyphenol hydroxylase-like FAD-dependent oxidoreductase